MNTDRLLDKNEINYLSEMVQQGLMAELNLDKIDSRIFLEKSFKGNFTLLIELSDIFSSKYSKSLHESYNKGKNKLFKLISESILAKSIRDQHEKDLEVLEKFDSIGFRREFDALVEKYRD